MLMLALRRSELKKKKVSTHSIYFSNYRKVCQILFIPVLSSIWPLLLLFRLCSCVVPYMLHQLWWGIAILIIQRTLRQSCELKRCSPVQIFCSV